MIYLHVSDYRIMVNSDGSVVIPLCRMEPVDVLGEKPTCERKHFATVAMDQDSFKRFAKSVAEVYSLCFEEHAHDDPTAIRAKGAPHV